MPKFFSSRSSAIAAILTIFAIVAAAADQLHAGVILPNLPPGSQYQLVFVTADGRDATSSNIAVYDQFVAEEAALSPSLPATTWRAIASTASIDARDHAVNYPSIPIYNTHGQLVANGTSEFWFPVHTFLINYDQYGLRTSHYVWTGTNPNGTANSPLGPPNARLGTSDRPGAGEWIYFSQGGTWGAESFYAMSAPITVVPEPGTLALLSSAVVVTAGFGLWRQRRKAAK